MLLAADDGDKTTDTLSSNGGSRLLLMPLMEGGHSSLQEEIDNLVDPVDPVPALGCNRKGNLIMVIP